MEKTTVSFMYRALEAAGKGAAIIAGSISAVALGLISVPGALVGFAMKAVWACLEGVWNTLLAAGSAILSVLTFDADGVATAVLAVVDGVKGVVVKTGAALVEAGKTVATAGVTGFAVGSGAIAAFLNPAPKTAPAATPQADVISAAWSAANPVAAGIVPAT